MTELFRSNRGLKRLRNRLCWPPLRIARFHSSEPRPKCCCQPKFAEALWSSDKLAKPTIYPIVVCKRAVWTEEVCPRFDQPGGREAAPRIVRIARTGEQRRKPFSVEANGIEEDLSTNTSSVRRGRL